MVYPVKNQATQNRIPADDMDYDYPDPSLGEDIGGFELEGDSFVGGAGMGSEDLSVKGLRNRIKELLGQLEASSLPQGQLPKIRADLEDLLTQVGSAAFAKDKDVKLAAIAGKLGNLEPRILGIDSDADLPGGWGDEGPAEPVTQNQILELIQSLEKGERDVEEGSKVSKEECLTKLREALADFGNGREKAATVGYHEVVASLGGPKDAKELFKDAYGETPSKIEGSNVFFDGKDDTSFSLKSADQGKTVILPNATELTLTPKDKSTPVKITGEGENYVIQIGSDSFRVNKDAKIRIYSDKVSGDGIGNKDGKIVVGASEKSEQKFSDPAKMKETADNLENANIGDDKAKYGFGGADDKKNTEAKKVLSAVAEALRETDPEKRKGLWEEAVDQLKRSKAEIGGSEHLNDFSQVIFNVIFGELGKSDFKTFLKDGLIPDDFVSEMASQLTENEGEKSNHDATNVRGISKDDKSWTHGASAEFLKKYSGQSSDSED